MNKLHCNVILDLLPLYADNVVSPESRNLIENHLTHCPSCRTALDGILASISVPQCYDDSLLKKIRKKQIIRRTVFAIFAVVWVVLLLGYPAMGIYYSTKDRPPTDFGPESFLISKTAEGKPLLLLEENAIGAHVYYLYERTEDGGTSLYLYIYDQDTTPEWLHNLIRFQPLSNPFYLIYGIGPEFNLGNEDRGSTVYSNYLGVRGFALDDSIQEVYYQTITSAQQQAFFSTYLSPFYMLPLEELPPEVLEYRAPEASDRVLIWSAK